MRTTKPLERATSFSLIAAQVALSLMVGVAAASLIRTMQRLNAIDSGFDAHGVVAFTVAPSPQRFTTGEAAYTFYARACPRPSGAFRACRTPRPAWAFL